MISLKVCLAVKNVATAKPYTKKLYLVGGMYVSYTIPKKYTKIAIVVIG